MASPVVAKERVTQYGGIQFALVRGRSATKPGVEVARVGVFDKGAGVVLSDDQINGSNLGQGIADPQVVANGEFFMYTVQRDFAPGNPLSGVSGATAAPSGVVGTILSEKEIGGQQREVTAAGRYGSGGRLDILSEKEIASQQSAVAGVGAATGGPKA